MRKQIFGLFLLLLAGVLSAGEVNGGTSTAVRAVVV